LGVCGDESCSIRICPTHGRNVHSAAVRILLSSSYRRSPRIDHGRGAQPTRDNHPGPRGKQRDLLHDLCYRRPPDWGPVGDHTVCALVNDVRVCAHHAQAHNGVPSAVTWQNALPLLSGSSGRSFKAVSPTNSSAFDLHKQRSNERVDCSNNDRFSQIVTSQAKPNARPCSIE
jgi:hypothetical protein